jgi:phenylalanyl-tRNA synthetase alpha chain
MHDTFFLSAPELAPPIADSAYFERVKTMHERGGDGSIGLRYRFSDEITGTNILRTHTTACSLRYLAGLAEEFRRTGELRPRKFFSVDRVFRNETLDPTHLAEFHQVERFVIDRGLSIADLMSYVKDFFASIGLTELEFKPVYNPYTEPSMEIFAVHPEKGIMEIGNSGIFRPEMLGPMVIPPEWSVVASRFSLERPTMIEYRMNEIRKLEGRSSRSTSSGTSPSRGYRSESKVALFSSSGRGEAFVRCEDPPDGLRRRWM